MEQLVLILVIKLTLLFAVILLGAWALRSANPRWRILLCEVGAAGALLLAVSFASPWSLPIPSFVGDLPSLAPVLPVELEGDSKNTVPLFSESKQQVNGSTAVFQTTTPTASSYLPWVLVAIYAGGVLFLLGRQALTTNRLRQALRSLRSAEPATLSGIAALCQKMGIKRLPAILITEEEVSPLATHGPDGPTIVLPAMLLQTGREAVMNLALRHELHHLRNRDLLRERLMLLGMALLWFHPLAWFVRRKHSAAIEELGDRVAAEDAGIRRYTTALAELALQLQPQTLAGAAIPWFGTPEILSRLRRLRFELSHGHLPRLKGVLCIIMGLTLASAIGLAEAESQQKSAGTSRLAGNLTKEDQEKATQCAGKTLDFILAQP